MFIMYIGEIMKRTTIFTTENQKDNLRVLSRETGLTIAELIRRAIDLYTEQENNKKTYKRTNRTQ